MSRIQHTRWRLFQWHPLFSGVALASFIFNSTTKGVTLYRGLGLVFVGIWFVMCVIDWATRHRLLDWMYSDEAGPDGGPGGFGDFMTNPGYRKAVEEKFARYEAIRPPENPSREYIEKLVADLLEEEESWFARKELGMIGAAAAPVLTEALKDPRYSQVKWPSGSTDATPLESVLELLAPLDAGAVMGTAGPLVGSEDEQVRKTAALHLATVGREETVPTLGRLMGDANGYVRSYVCIGVERAVSAGRATEGFRRAMYDVLLPQCDQRWPSGALNDAASTVVALDRARAAVDLATERYMGEGNNYAYQAIRACTRAGIALPPELIRPIYDRALVLASQPQTEYPAYCVAEESLPALVAALGEGARPMVEAALAHSNADVREAGARELARLAGVTDAVNFVSERASAVGVDGLTDAQRTVYLAFVFDAEVCNGGLMQFFGNSGGAYAVETLAALRELGNAEAEAALAGAMKLIGPLARETERDMRMAAFDGRYKDLKGPLNELDSRYYGAKSDLRQQWLRYAADRPGEFGGTRV